MPAQLSSEPVVGIVDAALLPASLAARVSRETRSCSTRTGRVRRQNIRSASRSPIFSRLWTASGRSWIERRSVILRVVSRCLRRPQRALPRGSSCHGFSAFCRRRSMKRSSVGPLVEALGRAPRSPGSLPAFRHRAPAGRAIHLRSSHGQETMAGRRSARVATPRRGGRPRSAPAARPAPTAPAADARRFFQLCTVNPRSSRCSVKEPLATRLAHSAVLAKPPKG